jgi:hypothetical protein
MAAYIYNKVTEKDDTPLQFDAKYASSPLDAKRTAVAPQMSSLPAAYPPSSSHSGQSRPPVTYAPPHQGPRRPSDNYPSGVNAYKHDAAVQPRTSNQSAGYRPSQRGNSTLPANPTVYSNNDASHYPAQPYPASTQAYATSTQAYPAAQPYSEAGQPYPAYSDAAYQDTYYAQGYYPEEGQYDETYAGYAEGYDPSAEYVADPSADYAADFAADQIYSAYDYGASEVAAYPVDPNYAGEADPKYAEQYYSQQTYRDPAGSEYFGEAPRKSVKK